MKTLVFGIDGLGKRSLRALGLSRLDKRMNAGVVENSYVRHNLSRGWPEIYTGLNAFESGAYYQAPEVVGQTIAATQNTGCSRLSEWVPKQNFLWNKLNEAGNTVGIYMVPTVTKPEEINGFFVSATGAGKFSGGLTAEDVYPSGLLEDGITAEADYAFRMGYDAYIPSSVAEFVERSNEHISAYFSLLTSLVDTHKVDVVFAATRFVNELAYKFIQLCEREPRSAFEEQLRTAVLGVAENFDIQLDNFIEQANPGHLFIVSDHGIGPYDTDLNLSELVAELGYCQRSQTLKSRLKKPVRDMLSKVYPKAYPPRPPYYERDSSEIFSAGYTGALYLNDQRFLGKQNTPSQREELISTAVEKLNAAMAQRGAAEISFSATPLLSSPKALEVGIAAPDILCDFPNGVNNSERFSSVLHRFERNFDTMFAKGFPGEFSGCKTSDTLCAYIGNKSQRVDLSKLTTVYDSVLNVSGAES